MGFFHYFTLLLAILLGLKIFLTIERTARRKWPTSLRYLWQIIDWKAESKKLLALALIAFLLTLLRPY